MRAAYYIGNGSFAIMEAPGETVEPGCVQIEVAYTGICGTDLHIYDGDMDGRVHPPAVLGHEMSGRVYMVGPGVDGLKTGQAVTVRPVKSCGSCAACQYGNGHICENLVFRGIDAPGSMQGLWSVPAESVVPVPSSISLRDAALVEPTAVAVHDVERAAVALGERCVVVGGGPVGLLIALVARVRGAEVIVVEPAAERRRFAESLEVRTVDPSSVNVAAYARKWSGGRGADVSFEVSGTAGGLATAAGVLRERGRLCLVGVHAMPREVDLHLFFWRELSLVGARLYTEADFHAALAVIAARKIPASEFISGIVPISEVADAFASLKAGGAMKILVDCQATGL